MMKKRKLKYRKILGIVWTGFTMMLLSGCFADDAVTPDEQLKEDLSKVDPIQLSKDIEIIDTYLDENQIIAVEDETGLRYVIHEEGEGISPELADGIRVKYVGTLLGESDVFDSSNDAFFPLNNLILGWKIGFQHLHEGDSATFYIPSGLGYGESGNGTAIPANANLVFGVKLIDVQRF